MPKLSSWITTRTKRHGLKSGKTISDISYECAVDEERLRGELEDALQSLGLI